MADGRRCARVTAFCQGEPTKAVEFTTLPALAPPGPGQAAVRLVYAPINPSDINVLEGTYLHLPDSLPAVVGGEGAGVVTAVGEGVEGIAVGDRVFNGEFVGRPQRSGLAFAQPIVIIDDRQLRNCSKY